MLALGGGWGHACRVAAARHTLGLTGGADVLVSDPELPPALLPGCRLAAPPAGLRRDRVGLAGWIADWLGSLEPDLVWVDAFPAGVLGELGPGLAPGARWELLVRRLRWDKYAATRPVRPPAYARAWLTEPVEEAQRAWLVAQVRRLEPLDLVDPPADPAAAAGVELPDGCWLVIHTGPVAEVALLIQAAPPGAAVVVVAPRDPGLGERWVSLAPASPLAARPEVAGVVTAGGASSVRQYAHLGPRHRIVPLARPLDDQTRRSAGGGRRPVRNPQD